MKQDRITNHRDLNSFSQAAGTVETVEHPEVLTGYYQTSSQPSQEAGPAYFVDSLQKRQKAHQFSAHEKKERISIQCLVSQTNRIKFKKS